MTDARLGRFWHRAGPLVAFAGLAVAAAAQGCGGGGETTMGSSSSSSGTGTGGSTSSTMSSSTGGLGGTGGTGGTGGSTGGSGGISNMSAVSDATIPLDATPDPAGTKVYFTGVDPANGPGVFSVPADGSSAASPVKVGAPFAAPFGITISSDGKTLYVADPGATDPASTKDLGVIFSLPVGGGMPAVVTGSELTEARSLEIGQEGGEDVIYFTARDKTDGSVGVFKIATSGGTIKAIAKGDPFRDPSGLAVASDGTLYVVDTVAAGTHRANVFKVASGGTVTPFLQDINVGYPAGVALSKDEKTLIISSLDATKKTDVLLQVDIATAQPTPFSTGIDTFTEGAGIHRARNANVYSFVDSSAGMSSTSVGGKVFVGK